MSNLWSRRRKLRRGTLEKSRCNHGHGILRESPVADRAAERHGQFLESRPRWRNRPSGSFVSIQACSAWPQVGLSPRDLRTRAYTLLRGAECCYDKLVSARLTESPVQKMGHCSHGASRERTQVLRYGLRTINGRTGGVRVEALATAAAAAPTKKLNCML